MSGGLNFEYRFNTNSSKPLDEEMSMRVYFLGNFTGITAAEKDNVTHSIVNIDIDNFDEVMAKLSPSIQLPSGEIVIFKELEDFHPDSLFDHVIFNDLRRLKRELNNTFTAEKAVQEILIKYQSTNLDVTEEVGKDTNSAMNDSAHLSAENTEDMFERLLGKKQRPEDDIDTKLTDNSPSNQQGKLNQFLAKLLSPLVIQNVTPEHKNLLLFIDTAIEELMKSILHSKEFQALEAAWRSVREVIFNSEYDESYQSFYVVNANKQVLEESISSNNIFLTKLSQHIKNTDSDCYDVLIGNYRFSDTTTDIKTLNYLASFAETLNCQLISGANESLINAAKDSLWYQFKQTPQAKSVALSYPQILLRLPYGKSQDEIETFPFEEVNQPHRHADLLWGNSAFNCVQLLINQYHNAQNKPFNRTITELPAFVFTNDGEQKLHPCGEFLFSEQQLIDISSQGIMVFVSYRNKNSIRLFTDSIYAVNSE